MSVISACAKQRNRLPRLLWPMPIRLGLKFQLYDGLTLPTALEWRTQLGKFVGETWGHHYGTPVFSGEGSKRTRPDERESAIYDVLRPTLARLSAFFFPCIAFLFREMRLLGSCAGTTSGLAIKQPKWGKWSLTR